MLLTPQSTIDSLKQQVTAQAELLIAQANQRGTAQLPQLTVSTGHTREEINAAESHNAPIIASAAKIVFQTCPAGAPFFPGIPGVEEEIEEARVLAVGEAAAGTAAEATRAEATARVTSTGGPAGTVPVLTELAQKVRQLISWHGAYKGFIHLRTSDQLAVELWREHRDEILQSSEANALYCIVVKINTFTDVENKKIIDDISSEKIINLFRTADATQLPELCHNAAVFELISRFSAKELMNFLQLKPTAITEAPDATEKEFCAQAWGMLISHTIANAETGENAEGLARVANQYFQQLELQVQFLECLQRVFEAAVSEPAKERLEAAITEITPPPLVH